MAKQSEEPSPEEMAVGNAIFEFTPDLYKVVTSSSPSRRNLMISPYSVSIGLALTMLGAAGTSESQLTSALKLPETSGKSLHKGYKGLKKRLNSVKGMFFSLIPVNALFLRTGAEFHSNYLSDSKKYFGTKPKLVNFIGRIEKSRTKISAWMEGKTSNKITNFVTANSLSAKSFIVLVNALYLKGDWLRKFKIERTQKKKFFVSKTESAEIDMMQMEEDKWLTGVSEEFDCKVLEIPYKDKKLSMVIILPNEMDGLANLEQKFTVANLRTMLSSLQSRDTAVSIPKFRMEVKCELQELLPKMGIMDIFDDKKSDFSKMIHQKGGRVTDVIHKSVIEIDESGTETSTGSSEKDLKHAQSEQLKFEADHPFLFIVKENSTGIILFVGRFCQPTTP